MCSYQLHTFQNMLKQREDHRSGKLDGEKKNPLRQRFKVNFQECLGGECLLELDKGKEYNRSLLFLCWGTVLNWLIRKWNCVSKHKVTMKGFSCAEGLLSRAQKTVTISIWESDVLHVITVQYLEEEKYEVDRKN